MAFFTDLIVIDASENYLSLEPFGILQSLKELRMACNNISIVKELHGFENLMYLDLSYNRLDKASVLSLAVLPNLKDLDLSGNNLRELPLMTTFASLEKIILEYNSIDDPAVFSALSNVPNLRHIALANNFLSRIPSDACVEGSLR